MSKFRIEIKIQELSQYKTVSGDEIWEDCNRFQTSWFESDQARQIYNFLTSAMELVACSMCWGRMI